jgi:hypothetical protein
MDLLIGSKGAGVGSSGPAEALEIAIMSFSVPNSAARHFGEHAGAVGKHGHNQLPAW